MGSPLICRQLLRSIAVEPIFAVLVSVSALGTLPPASEPAAMTMQPK